MGVAETVRVDARSRSYDVVVGWGLLASLGARPIPRSEYLPMLNQINSSNTLFGNWSQL